MDYNTVYFPPELFDTAYQSYKDISALLIKHNVDLEHDAFMPDEIGDAIDFNGPISNAANSILAEEYYTTHGYGNMSKPDFIIEFYKVFSKKLPEHNESYFLARKAEFSFIDALSAVTKNNAELGRWYFNSQKVAILTLLANDPLFLQDIKRKFIDRLARFADVQPSPELISAWKAAPMTVRMHLVFDFTDDVTFSEEPLQILENLIESAPQCVKNIFKWNDFNPAPHFGEPVLREDDMDFTLLYDFIQELYTSDNSEAYKLLKSLFDDFNQKQEDYMTTLPDLP